MNICTFWRLQFTKLTKFRAPKIAKKLVLELLDSPKLISRKILKFPHCNLGQCHVKNLPEKTRSQAIQLQFRLIKFRVHLFQQLVRKCSSRKSLYSFGNEWYLYQLRVNYPFRKNGLHSEYFHSKKTNS